MSGARANATGSGKLPAGRISKSPRSWSPNPVLVAAIGADGCALLRAIDQAAGQPWLAQIPAVQILRRVWAEQDGPVRWREIKDMPAPATLMSSPYRWRKVACFHRRGLAPKNSFRPSAEQRRWGPIRKTQGWFKVMVYKMAHTGFDLSGVPRHVCCTAQTNRN